MRSLLIVCALLQAAPGVRAGRPPASEVTLVDPGRADAQAPRGERDWSLRVIMAEPIRARARRALVALARPCSSWTSALREHDGQAGQRMFEQCMRNAMAGEFGAVELLESPRRQPSSAESAVLEALMQIELDCVERLARSFDVIAQDRYRRELNSFHVAERKARFMQRCLRERTAAAGLKDNATYRYVPSRAAPTNH